jgi:hypothetical protein
MKLVDSNGHDWWNPLSWVSSASNALSTVKSAVSSTVNSGVSFLTTTSLENLNSNLRRSQPS